MKKLLSPFRRAWFLLAGAAPLLALAASAQPEGGFVSLFDGQTLAGWKMMNQNGAGYGVTNGVIYCPKGEHGQLLSEKEYSDFVLRFEFKLTPGANNGIGLRTPPAGDPAYVGIESQVLDDSAEQYAALQPWQYHGSLYGIVAPKRGSQKPVGEWNEQEISAIGRHVKITVNGKTIIDADLNGITDPEIIQKHPGMFRTRGYISLLGHNDYVEFRNIRIRELVSKGKDEAPKGFETLFNGRNLKGWKGLVGDPAKRAKMSADNLKAEQIKADIRMHESWKVEQGALAYRGDGFDNICTKKDYGNFELLVDWKIAPHSDSGLYLRGSPQVQIWDPHTKPTSQGSEAGSGGLYNNKTHPAGPLKVADKAVGEWNRFRILMAGDKVHVFLNDELVVNNVTLENYWDRKSPLFPAGQIEFQAHKTPVWFRNIYIREIPAGK